MSMPLKMVAYRGQSHRAHAPPAGGLGAKEDEDYSAVFVSERERLVEMLTDKELVAPQREYPEAVKDTATSAPC